ncbi:hypothetical protein BDZ94DRAFT_1127223, partial [Collybia nuda]
GAFHNSGERFNPPKCHPKTRIAILNTIRDWYRSEDISVPRIMWLYGPAGSGKSAISQSMAEECHKAGTLAASFFFSRTALGRNDASRLVATIAHQIAYSITDAQLLIQREIENDPMVFSKSLATQLYQLVARPLCAITPDTSGCWPKLIIIDGLDECNGGEIQRAIISSFASMATQYSIPLRIMISSRPEQSIRGTFSLPDKNWTYVSLVLGDNYESTCDIALFLWDSFLDIRNTHVLKLYIPEKWPSQHDVDILVQKSSGQFIFASTAMRYIK